jgi:hypothetical protein
MIESVLVKAGGEGAIPMSPHEPSPRDTLLQLTNAFRASQAIHVAATLGVTDLLEDGPRSVDELAHATGTHAHTLYRLLRALASVGVFAEEPDGKFGSTPLAEYLRTNAPRSLRAWAMQCGQPYLWASWGHLLHSVRTGEPAFPELYETTVWEYRQAHPKEDAVFNAAMTALSAGVVEAIVQSYDFSGMGVLMDVGGGEGVLIAAILAANPTLHGVLFDQPHVLTGAKDLLEREGVEDRCELVSGSFFEAVPEGATAHLLKSVVHDWDDNATVKILRACRAAIADTGRLLVVEPIIRAGNEPDPAKFSDLNMLVMLGGQERTAEDFERLYAEAGFRLTDIIHTGSSMSIIEGIPI